jgi:hypothetical protein
MALLGRSQVWRWLNTSSLEAQPYLAPNGPHIIIRYLAA